MSPKCARAGPTLARGAAHFLREHGGTGALSPGPEDDSRYGPTAGSTHGVVSVCRKMDVRFSITRFRGQHKSLHNLMEAHTRRCLDAEFLTGWTVPPMWPRPPAPAFQAECGRRAGTAHRPAGEADARFPSWPVFAKSAIMASSPTGTGSQGSNWRLTIAATPRSRMPAEGDLKYGVGLNQLPSGPLRRQRRLAGRPDDGCHNLAEAGRRGPVWESRIGHHQDPPAAVLLPGRTAHPLGHPVDPASSGSLALG